MKREYLIEPAVIDCIANDRAPNVGELFGVAERIWTDMRGRTPMFAWDDLPAGSAERMAALRAAQTALRGSE